MGFRGSDQTRNAQQRYQLRLHRARSVVLTSQELVEIRAAQRTFEGAYIRTSLGQFSFALVVLKIFTSEFYSIGALFAVYGAGVLGVSFYRRMQGNRQFFSEVGDDGLSRKRFRTSGNVVVVLTALSVAAYVSLLVLTLRLNATLARFAMATANGRIMGEVKKMEEQPGTSKDDVDRLRSQLDKTLSPTSTAVRFDESAGKLQPNVPRAPSSPRIPPIRQSSGSSTPRIRPTTLDIPGLTKSKVSPDGRIAQRDVGAKLVIVMVGLPARGKSYITKKLARYLNWLQHDTKIFNVGERRRQAAGGHPAQEKPRQADSQIPSLSQLPNGLIDFNTQHTTKSSQPLAEIVLNGHTKLEPPATPPPQRATMAPAALHDTSDTAPTLPRSDSQQGMDQSAAFFDPANKEASLLREQVAMETLDELLDFILLGSGSVGILDATNSTLKRREVIVRHIRERAGPELNVLFLESQCLNQDLLEANMRLKLNGPDYKEMDPVVALEDFRKRVKVYEKAYVPLGEYEEANNIPFIQMIDVGRKIISHQIRGFLSAQANYYLLNFNLAPRQIWICRHGLSEDNVAGKLGGDSDLAPEGVEFAKALTRFMDEKRSEWESKQIETMRNTHFPPRPGDATPPNPHYTPQSPLLTTSDSGPQAEKEEQEEEEELPAGYSPKAFCVWTSMLKRSIQTAQFFNDEEYDTKQMRMLDELNAGVMEGLTYNCVSTKYPEEYKARKADKLHYRYPGPGGEGYLDIINRVRPVIVELERMTDHVLLVGHRSVARVLLAYFRGLKREDVANLDVPIGMLYCLEPKPYGVDFKVYKWDKSKAWFFEVPDFKLKRAEDDMI
ncbi:hypothetical protein AMS68_007140 [Peltaster fructicola]|uniref:6-phosphofructo-2-kinase domain-containing protein n=1 Tax=Peltaster fructicola TaxID=286661 RepID=A0A6H0Y3P9_9PEZI|nr:hypothetical protein AMS68_007140 [Peltaster fructicola]